MSTTIATTAVEEAPKTITLHNGQTFKFNSNVTSTLDHIPIIDVSRIYSDNLEDRKAVAEEIRTASKEIGFFYMINHGIDAQYADGVMEQAKSFFALPEEKKMKVFTGLVPNEYVGFHPMEHYNRNGWKHRDLSEAFNWAYDAQEDPEAVDKSEPSVSIWPSEQDAPGFRKTLYAYHTQLLQLSRRLTRIFALALHLPEDSFDEYIKHPEAGMRILHYPEQKHSADEQNGIG